MLFYIWLTEMGAAMLKAQSDLPESKVIILNRHSQAVKSVAFSKDGSRLATGSDDKTIGIWKMPAGELITVIENNFFPMKDLQFFSADELFVASGPDIKLIDFDGKIIRTFPGKTAHIWSLDHSSTTGKLTGGSYGKTIRVWDITTGKEIMILEGHEKSTLPVCFSPSGDRILSGSLDMSVRLWDADSGKSLGKMEFHSGNIFSVAFHPGGRYAASASADKTIRLWNLETGKVVQTYNGHNGAVMDITFSPDGKHLLSASDDHTIILWETVSGNKLYTFTGHKGTVNAIAFSPDAGSFASASDDKTARVWTIEKRMFVEFYFLQDIENEVADSPLFNARSEGETRQEYQERQEKAVIFQERIYDKYYQQYILNLDRQSLDDLNQ